MEDVSRELQRVHSRYGPLEGRVEQILADIRRACRKSPEESYNRANERQVEEFIGRLGREFPGRTFQVARGREAVAERAAERGGWPSAPARTDAPCAVIERQRLSAWALRTTRWNYLFTVPGDSADRIVLVAHYDTWRGPGADDNTTGEEILKHYLLADLGAERRPALTHTYFLAGSEECGLVGLMSQVLLALGLVAANFALAYREWLYVAAAVGLCPLASYRFGVSGSREYVRTLREEELRLIRAVVSVDSVGEGRMYIPRSTLGADFIRALIPFGDYDSLNDLLEEAAHLHGVKYNTYLAGGTTDHVSFLEVNNGLWHRARDGIARVLSPLSGRSHVPPLRVPAAALIAMLPGKASPLVYGGKIHTPRDVPERVYPGPLREALLILDYFMYRLEGGARIGEPRALDEFHYARLYREAGRDRGRGGGGGGGGGGGRHYVAFKDAIEPNRRNLNAVYRASATVEGRRAVARIERIVGWGVETRLRDQSAAAAVELGERWERVPIEDLEVVRGGLTLRFARRRTVRHFVERIGRRAIAALERAMGRWSFLAFFATAYLVAEAGGWALYAGLRLSAGFQAWFIGHEALMAAVVIALQLAVTLLFMIRLIPTWMDNSYRHENRADNLGSLRRQGPVGPGIR